MAALVPLPFASPYIRLAVIDGVMFDDEAASANIQSAPTTLLDDSLRWTGLPSVKEIVGLILDRDPSKLSPSALRGMIENGDAAGLARLMVKTGKLFPALVSLLSHEKWQVRLGAMACYEYLVEADPDLAALYVDPLWDRFQQADDQVRGDIAYILGESKCRDARAKLEAIVEGDFSRELKEAAQEAMSE